MRYNFFGILLPLPGSAQCNGINLAIINKEQSILSGVDPGPSTKILQN